ncbi:MAG: type II secretion system F family protein [Planctomycetota bacterium]|nr:MAG: type II secretion system F family protein [Planctomycetota bacterium]
MAVYQYTAKDGTGRKFTGTYIADNLILLREELGKIGYVLVNAREYKNRVIKHRKINRLEVMSFAYRFSEMYAAGMPILACLETLERQLDNQAFKYIIADIANAIEVGSSLKNAFGKYKNIFSDFFLGMLDAGESGGKLVATLDMSAKYLEKQVDIRRKIKSAFAYPIVVSIMCLFLFVFLVVFVVPVFTKLYNTMHVPLPGPTRALLILSSFIVNWGWAIPFVVLGVVLLLRQARRNPRIGLMWDVFKLNMPVFARLNRLILVSRFIRTFSMLASVGVPFIDALDIASGVAHNLRMSQIAEGLQKAVAVGNPLGQSLKDYDIFPPVVTQLAVAGEEAGRLPEMLNKGAEILDRDIDRTVHSLLVKLEPALTFIMGSIIAFLLIAVYLPMYDYMAHLK